MNANDSVVRLTKHRQELRYWEIPLDRISESKRNPRNK